MEKRAPAGLCLIFAFLFPFLGAGLLFSQDPVVYRVKGDHRFDRFGSSLAVLNDVDGDGVNDFVAGATQQYIDPEAKPNGYVYLLSGRTGAHLRTWRGTETRMGLGYSLAALGDYDGDGKTDFVTAGSPDNVYIGSPMKDKWIATFKVPFRPRLSEVDARFAAADLNGDGIPDLVLGDDGHILDHGGGHWTLNVGRVLAFSGADWSVLWDIVGEYEQGLLGAALAMIGDVDGDGLPDVAVGEPMQSHFINEENKKGRVHILRGKDGKELRTIADDPGYYLGSTLANLGDLDGDSFPELAIASPGYRTNRGRDQGWVGIYSTGTFKVSRQFVGLEGELTLLFQGDALGYEVGSVGDVDLDQIPDYVIAAYRVGQGIGPDYGRLELRSGRSGALLAIYEERQFDNPWLGKVASLGDVDRDGRPEFLVGSPNVPTDILSDRETVHQGEVLVLRYEAGLQPFLRGDANGDGRVNIADVVAVLKKGYFGIDTGGCAQAYDADGDEMLTTHDVVVLLRYYFVGGYAPAPPFPDCGRFGGLRQSKFDCRSTPCGR